VLGSVKESDDYHFVFNASDMYEVEAKLNTEIETFDENKGGMIPSAAGPYTFMANMTMFLFDHDLDACDDFMKPKYGEDNYECKDLHEVKEKGLIWIR